MVIAEISQGISAAFTALNEQVPEQYRPLVILALYTLIIVIYAIFIWRFYKFLARRNIIELNLSQYNRTEHPTLNKSFASGLESHRTYCHTPPRIYFDTCCSPLFGSVRSICLLYDPRGRLVVLILYPNASATCLRRAEASTLPRQ